jgi:hypothetical protein
MRVGTYSRKEQSYCSRLHWIARGSVQIVRYISKEASDERD